MFSWRVKLTSTIIFAFLILNFLPAQAVRVLTPAEEANYLRYTQTREIARFLSLVDHLSPELNVTVAGKTRPVPSFDFQQLYLAVITEEGVARPEGLNRNKPTVFIFASQHGNEQSGKEASLALIRDLALGELRPLLKKLNFLILPQANPYGNWYDVRVNEQNLDLNRDHVKLEAEETAIIHRIFITWLPEITLDLHEKGDDYYRVSIGCVSNLNISPQLSTFSREVLFPEVNKSLEKRRITFFEYLVSQPMGIDSSAGVRYRPEEVAGRQTMWRYSTTDLNDGRNSLGIYETLAFIQECASRHDLETLAERTRWQYFGVRSLMEAVANHAGEALSLVRRLREVIVEKATVYQPDDLVHLRMEYARDEKNPTLSVKRFERPDSPVRGIMKVDKKAGDYLLQNEVDPAPQPTQYKIVNEVLQNWFPLVASKLSVTRPRGYVIPGQRLDIVDTLVRHGIKVEIVNQDRTIEVEAYEIKDVVPSRYDYLPPEKIEVEARAIQTLVRKGDFYVSCAQLAANLIPCLLEPQSQYGLIRYWSYHLVPEKGSLYALFRVVKPAALALIPYHPW
ncbi:MAG: M14 family zinc carboxypeptidase [Candidatus Aminicenantales bacterium]